VPRADPSRKRCAIYTRKSSEEGLEQEFNSLQAQCEACEAYIRSQRHEGWALARTRYDDGGFSGANMERPALQRLLADIQGGRIDIIVVYKVDRLTRSLADFARLVEIFDAQGVSFVPGLVIRHRWCFDPVLEWVNGKTIVLSARDRSPGIMRDLLGLAASAATRRPPNRGECRDSQRQERRLQGAALRPDPGEHNRGPIRSRYNVFRPSPGRASCAVCRQRRR
jgi:Resolvase, N terminal domain